MNDPCPKEAIFKEDRPVRVFVCRVNHDLSIVVTTCLEGAHNPHTCAVQMLNIWPELLLALSPEQQRDIVSYTRDLLLHRTADVRLVQTCSHGGTAPTTLPCVQMFIGDVHANTFLEMVIFPPTEALR